jgi:alpha-beta hydrolase superfamily lysophospholipase
VIWSEEYFVSREGVQLYVYRKRAQAPVAGEAPRPVLMLVHGSTVSGRNTYDLQVPGRSDYSVMDWFAARGYDVWTMDHEGYGRSGWSGRGNSDIKTGALDLAAAIPLILEKTGAQKINLFGSSSGALRACLYTAAHPQIVGRLGISALVYTGAGSPTL